MKRCLKCVNLIAPEMAKKNNNNNKDNPLLYSLSGNVQLVSNL